MVMLAFGVLASGAPAVAAVTATSIETATEALRPLVDADVAGPVAVTIAASGGNATPESSSVRR